MKKFFMTVCAMSLAMTGFAQVVTGSLTPANGKVYGNDAVYNGSIVASYTDTIAVTNAIATITSGGNSATATLENVSETGFYIPVASILDKWGATTFTVTVSGVKDKANVAVANVTGTYTYTSKIPYTGVLPETITKKEDLKSVEFNFSKNVTYKSIVITSGANSRTIPDGGTAVNGKVTVVINASDWGIPSKNQNNLQVALKGVKDTDNVPISNTQGSEGTISVNYTVEDIPATVTYLGVDPEEDWTYAEDIMGWDITLKFSDAVTLTDANATAVINYLDELDDVIADPVNIPMADINGMFNPREGYYGLFIPIPEAPVYTPGAVLAKMTITLQGITYNNAAVTLPDPLVTYEAAPAFDTFRAPATNAIQAEKIEANENVNIYSVQGILLKKDVPASTVNTLGKGLYIVGNKKVFVK